MNAQKEALFEKGWTEAELKANGWRARPWTEGTDRTWQQQMENRDFLHCPECHVIGTYKPRFNASHEHPRYFVCKWCGYGRDFFGEWQYRPDKKQGVWGIVGPDSGPTPKELIGNLDPFCG